MKKLFGGHKRPYKPYKEEDIEWDDEYTDEEYTDEYMDEEYFEEDADEEVYEDESVVYAEGEDNLIYEDDVIYEDEYASENDDISYEEDGILYEDEYAQDSSSWEDDDTSFEDDGEFYGGRSRKTKKKAAGGLWNTILHMNTMDRILMMTGVFVLVLALITGTFYLSASMLNKQVSSFGAIGNQLADIRVIGEAGLTAVADAELARINAANAVEEEEESKEYDEAEYEKEVKVGLNLTSIEKDLKIKFVNSKTNKLIGNVPFSVEVKTADGKTEVWTDDDMDGIIYKQSITSGSYTVTMQPLDKEKYADYILSTNSSKVEVKNKIEYKKVDVSDEIKTESEVNAAKEDTAKKETVVESALKDTVSWIDSTQSVTYVEVKKSEIKDPAASASLPSKFTRLTGAPVSTPPSVSIPTPQSVQVGKDVGLVVTSSYVTLDTSTATWTSSDNTIATVSSVGVVTGIQEGTVTITYTCTGKITVVTNGNSVEEDTTLTTTCIVKVENTTGITSVALDKATLALDPSKTALAKAQLTATVTASSETADKTVEWASSNEAVAKVDQNGLVTAVSAGTATITAKTNADSTKKAECLVTVQGAASTILTLSHTELTLSPKLTYKLVATTTPVGGEVIWTTDNAEIATVDAQGTVTGVKEGKAVITATTANGLTSKCTVNVVKLMTLDKTTATVGVGGEATVTVKVAASDDGKGVVKAFSGDDKKLLVSVKDKVVTLKGIAAGSTAITVSYTTALGVIDTMDCTVTVVNESGQLKDNNGELLYIKNADGTFTEAKVNDYYKYDVFYSKVIKYTGWQTLNGKVYFYDTNGKYMTGEQIIQGAKYNFASDGSLVVGSSTFGIDVSKWNGTIDWNAVKNSGVSYVIIRCGYRGSSVGALIEDPKFKANIKGATAAGLKVGVYFFSQAINNAEAVEEASMVLQQVKGYTISYPIFLDVESSGGRGDKIDSATRTAVIKTFCETIQSSGYTAGVYANKSWLENKMDASQLTKYKIWLAQYAATPTYTKTKYDMWQYKDTGRVTGISGNVDFNISYLGY